MWKFLVILSFAAFAQSCRVIEQKANGVSLEQNRPLHPSIVLIETFVTYELKQMCSGVLISENLVLTTRHCIFGAFFVNVHIYAHKLRYVFEDQREIYRSSVFHFKDDFDGSKYLNDVALIQIPTLNVNDRPYGIADLPTSILLPPGSEGKVVGWGLLNYKDENAAAFKQEQTMRIVADDVCRQAYSLWNNEEDYAGRICIQKPFGKNCVSDVGSPFFIGNVVHGLQSFGQLLACDEAYPNGLQEVRYHLEWIQKIIDDTRQ